MYNDNRLVELNQIISDVIYKENQKAIDAGCDVLCTATEYLADKIAEVVYKYHREEIDALRWTNKELIRVEKEKRRELWKKARSMDKIYKTVEQECDGCGKHFYLKYCSDGTYEYIGEVCTCLATFHPVNGEPSISEWIEQIKE